MPHPSEFSFRAVAEADLPLLQEWLTRPHVAAWWDDPGSIDQLRDDYVTHAHEPRATLAYIASRGGRDVGFIQCYCVMGCGGGWWEDETDPGARGIDQFLVDGAALSQGIGRALIRAFIQRVFADPAVTVIQTDPDPTNERAIRCYVAAGFRPVGTVATPDGDALLLKIDRLAPRVII